MERLGSHGGSHDAPVKLPDSSISSSRRLSSEYACTLSPALTGAATAGCAPQTWCSSPPSASLDSVLALFQSSGVLHDPLFYTLDPHPAGTISGILLPLPEFWAHVVLAEAI